MNNKVKFLFILVIVLFCWVGKVQSKDEKKEATEKNEKSDTVNTPPANSNTTVTEIPDVTKTADYEHFLKALDQTNDDYCLYHLIVLSINLFHINQVNAKNTTICDNKYFKELDPLRNRRPCDHNKDKYLKDAVDYMDNHIQLYCHTTNKYDISSLSNVPILCPIINDLKTNYTLFQDEIVENCNKTSSSSENIKDSCIYKMLTNYKKMHELRDNAKKSKKYSSQNVTIYLNVDKFDNEDNKKLYSRLEECSLYKEISSAITITISFITILILSLFINFINM